MRRVKRDQNDIMNDRFASALLENRSRDFWSEVQRITNKSSQSSNVVDGLSTPQEISNYFASKYHELYTCVSYDNNDMDKLDVKLTILFL